jgi:hypothetical protein
MSTDTQEIQEPVDDATIVNDEQTPEQSHDELVAKVAKKLNRDEWGTDLEESEAKSEDKTEETPSKKKDEKPVLSKELQARAEKAGFDKELVERLHQSGQLEDTLSAFDRLTITRTQAEPEKTETKEPVEDQEEEYPDLDPDVYDEEIVKRDRYHKQRIDALQEQIDLLLSDRQYAFEQWMDGVLSELGYDIEDVEKCQKTFKAYKGLCEANGVSPEKRDKALVERAHAAMFPEEVKQQTQRETINRLRDAEGKFLSSTKSGAPPQKQLSSEESHEQLVSNVAAYLKKNGVKMNGY